MEGGEHPAVEGAGVGYNALHGNRLAKGYITQDDADFLCQNPCYWYYMDGPEYEGGPRVEPEERGTKRVEHMGMCYCYGISRGNENVYAMNWC